MRLVGKDKKYRLPDQRRNHRHSHRHAKWWRNRNSHSWHHQNKNTDKYRTKSNKWNNFSKSRKKVVHPSRSNYNYRSHEPKKQQSLSFEDSSGRGYCNYNSRNFHKRNQRSSSRHWRRKQQRQHYSGGGSRSRSRSSLDRSVSMSSGSDTDTTGYDTAAIDTDTEFENDRRPSQRSNSQHPQQRRPRGRNSGRRQRQRNRQQRNSAYHDESWYFPNQAVREETPEDEVQREALVSANENWIANLPVLPSQLEREANIVSPLARENRDHSMRWADNTGRVTVLPTSTEPTEQAQAVPNQVADAADPDAVEDQEREDQVPRPNPVVTRRPETREQFIRENLPASNIDVNFNLANQLAERNRVMQMISRQASQIQVAASNAAASFQQLLETARNSGNLQNVLDNVNSWIHWGTAITGTDTEFNLAASDNDRLNNEEERNEHRRAARRTRQVRHQRRTPREHRHRGPVGGANQQHLPHRGWYDATNNNLPADRNLREDIFHDSQTTLLPQSESSQEHQLATGAEEQQGHNHTTEDEDPFARFDAAIRRQEERSEWRDRQRRRQTRQDRRGMENRRRERRRPNNQRSSTSTLEPGSQASLPAANNPNPPNTRPGAAPTPPPLPPDDWNPAPRIRNEWTGMQDDRLNTPTALNENLVNGPDESQLVYESDTSEDESMASATSAAMDIEGLDPLDSLLRSYTDPGESSGQLGTFIQNISQRSRVLISRVRTRITKQYFRKGDFQMALADFRTLNPEHPRQVLGVGFTGTINNMYRLTVKQNSSFGKPTFEIRPMNKRIRKKRIHVCYKIRYLFGRERGRRAQRSPPISTPV